VRGVPSLSVHNRFAVLENTPPLDTFEVSKPLELQTEATPNPKPRKRSIPRWERRLPKKYVLAATPSAKSLSIKVELQTTDTAEVKSSLALIDSGATGKFLDKKWVEEQHIATKLLSRPIAIYNVDGTLNENGAITEVASLIL